MAAQLSSESITGTQGRPSRLVAAVFLAVSMMACIGALLSEAPRQGSDPGSDPGPASYPLLVTALMVLCSVLLFFERGEKRSIKWGDMRRVALIVGSLLVYFGLMHFLGFIISSVVFIFVALMGTGERRIALIAIYTLGLPMAVYAVFSILLGLMLPMGPVEVLL